MKPDSSWKARLAILLISLSAALYLLHYVIFHDLRHIFIYLLSDLAFLFLNVLVVVLFIEDMLERREKKAILNKMNMVIGTFFSEVGLELLRRFSTFVRNTDGLKPALAVTARWTGKDFARAGASARDFAYDIRTGPGELAALRRFLTEKYPFLLRLLENPNLLEHGRFTDLLWAVFHMTEELTYRGDKLDRLPAKDYLHLAGDLKRAYSQLVAQWLAYLEHLQRTYPFLYSLAVRINPLSPNPSAIIDSVEPADKG
jgi:hypothetical protein